MNSELKKLAQFIRQLHQRYAQSPLASDRDTGEGKELTDPAFELTLAAAALRDGQLRTPDTPDAVQVAVIGPTQTGKSTIVNLLLGQHAAVVNPLAGYTKHLQGFALNTNTQELLQVERYFEDWQQQAPGNLTDNYRVYSLVPLTPNQSTFTNNPCVVWDSPDFDSFTSRRYRDAVLEIIGLCDVIVLVLSKEKYSDLSVWRILKLVRSLRRELIVCVNKLTSAAWSPIIGSVTQHLHIIMNQDIQVIGLPYVADLTSMHSFDQAAVTELQTSIDDRLVTVGLPRRMQGVKTFILEHWDSWTTPIKLEHQCQVSWETVVAEAVAEAKSMYRSQYLNARHYDTFRRAVIQLLELLELPILAKPLSQIRRVITWPVRKIISSFTLGHRATSDGSNMELGTLAEIHAHIRITVRRAVADKCQGDDHQARWWRALGKTMDAQQADIEQVFRAAILTYQDAFQPEVERAGQSLYERLKQQPATLNALRAARVTTDAAGVVLVLKTGGLGVNEAVLTPAMLSLTSFLTESAVGAYMSSVAADLKDSQFKYVSQVIENQVQARLLALVPKMEGVTLFQISRDELAQARDALTGLEA